MEPCDAGRRTSDGEHKISMNGGGRIEIVNDIPSLSHPRTLDGTGRIHHKDHHKHRYRALSIEHVEDYPTAVLEYQCIRYQEHLSPFLLEEKP